VFIAKLKQRHLFHEACNALASRWKGARYCYFHGRSADHNREAAPFCSRPNHFGGGFRLICVLGNSMVLRKQNICDIYFGCAKIMKPSVEFLMLRRLEKVFEARVVAWSCDLMLGVLSPTPRSLIDSEDRRRSQRRLATLASQSISARRTDKLFSTAKADLAEYVA
jgi:hypothetical protein